MYITRDALLHLPSHLLINVFQGSGPLQAMVSMAIECLHCDCTTEVSLLVVALVRSACVSVYALLMGGDEIMEAVFVLSRFPFHCSFALLDELAVC